MASKHPTEGHESIIVKNFTEAEESHLRLFKAQEEIRERAQALMDARRERLECLRIAQATLVENRRGKLSQEAVDVTAEAIQEYAATLVKFVEGA